MSQLSTAIFCRLKMYSLLILLIYFISVTQRANKRGGFKNSTENDDRGKMVAKEKAGVAMEKSLGLMSGVALVVGTIIGQS